VSTVLLTGDFTAMLPVPPEVLNQDGVLDRKSVATIVVSHDHRIVSSIRWNEIYALSVLPGVVLAVRW